MTLADLKAIVDIVILAVRKQDEMLELTQYFSPTETAFGTQHYAISRVTRADGLETVIALVLCGEGPGNAQKAMASAILELEPQLTILVGIAGGIPQRNHQLGLGDVVVAAAGYDVTRGELLPGKKRRTKGQVFYLHPEAANLVENINFPALLPQITHPRPVVSFPLDTATECSASWVTRLAETLGLETGFSNRLPCVISGTVASGADFLKDPQAAEDWEKEVRRLNAIPELVASEMEMIGVARGSTSNGKYFNWMLVKGVSDLVGLKRDPAWNLYAASAAASTALQFIKALALQPRAGRTHPTPTMFLDTIPRSIGEAYAGRTELMARMEQFLLPPPRSVTLTGFSGIGKTRIAAEFVWRYQQSFPGGLLWFNCSSSLGRHQQMLQAYTSLVRLPDKSQTTDELLEGIGSVISRTSAAVLVVLDNLHIPAGQTLDDALRPWCPNLKNTSVLITSHQRVVDPSTREVRVEPVNLDSAERILCFSIPSNEVNELFPEIARLVGQVPLALEIMNRILRLGIYTASEVHGALEDGLVKTVHTFGSLLEVGDSANGLLVTLDTAWTSLKPESQRLASLVAQLAPMPIPRELLNSNELVHDRIFLRELMNRNLISSLPSEHLEMHRLVADFIRSKDEEHHEFVAAARKMVVPFFEQTQARSPSKWQLYNALLPHAQHLATLQPQDTDALKLLVGIGTVLFEQGRSREALSFQQDALQLSILRSGEDSSDTRICKNNLATSLLALGDYEYAAQLLQTLVDTTPATENAHSSVMSLSNLMVALDAVGNLRAAIDLATKLQATAAKLEADDYEGQFLALNTQASIYDHAGLLAEAAQILKRLCQLSEQELGRDHPRSVIAFGNYACALAKAGNNVEAEAVLQRNLEISGPNFPHDHPSLVNLRINLAAVRSKQGAIDEAIVAYGSEKAILLKQLPSTHPSIVELDVNCAQCLARLGRFSEASALMNDAVRHLTESLGQGHPKTLSATSSYAQTLVELGQYEEAQGLLEGLVKTQLATYPSSHPEIAYTYQRIAAVCWKLDEPFKARQASATSVKVLIRVFGLQHEETLYQLHLFAVHLINSNKAMPAVSLLEFIYENLSNSDSELGVTVQSNLALALIDLGRHERARELPLVQRGFQPSICLQGKLVLQQCSILINLGFDKHLRELVTRLDELDVEAQWKLLVMAMSHIREGEYQLALKIFESAKLREFDSSKPEWRNVELPALRNIGFVQTAVNSYESSPKHDCTALPKIESLSV